MDWTQFALFFLGNFSFTLTLWLWNRSETRQEIRGIELHIRSIHEEMKDFHGRLCAIEERRK